MSSEEATRLRRAIYGADGPDRTDLVGLIGLAARSDDPDLFALLADVARDALLAGGRIASPDADWLMEVCGDGKGLQSYAEFEALTSVLRNADPAPADLVAFAAREVERAILTGERTLIGGDAGEPGRVCASDVEALRDICAASSPDRALCEVLFDIAHATTDNDAGFDAFFAETLRDYLIARTEGRLDEFVGALGESPAPEQPRPAAIDTLADALYSQAAEATASSYEAAARLPEPETRWVAVQLSRGALSRAELALIAALRVSEGAMAHAA